MKADHSSATQAADQFRITRWTVVLLSAQSRAPGYKEAFAELCKLYWYPLYAFIRRCGYNPDDAQDLTQGFFLHLLEHKTLRRADRLRGKFRTFLLGSLQNYLSTEGARGRCLKRGGNVEFVPLDTASIENRYGLEQVDALTPEKIFDARWAMALLREAMVRLSTQYSAQGKATVFEALKVFLDVANRKEPPSYEQAAEALNVSVGAVKTLIHRLRKDYPSVS